MRSIPKEKLIASTLVLLTSLSCSRQSYSLDKSNRLNNKLTGYNGIYQTRESGRKFILPKDSTQFYFADSIPDISFTEMTEIKKTYSQYNYRACLFIKLNYTSAVKFLELTRQNIGLPLLIIFNDQLIAAPIVQKKIDKGEIQITGVDEKKIDEFINKLK